MPVERSELITCLAEARQYYAVKLVGTRHIEVKGRRVAIVFERATTHLYSEEVKDLTGVPPAEKVVRNLPSGRQELRRFSLERAMLLDVVLPTLTNYCRSIHGTGPRGRDNRLVFGWPMTDGRSLCVALSPWRGESHKWTCVSAYPVSAAKLAEVRRNKPAPFPEIG
ncbi:MAG TPA: hypothetical protein VJN18_14490 [Polyangiaceae bacterium]|nr:hypothetical protein [Polyangiaceae bacterium]